LPIDVAEIQRDLDRRRPGQSVLTTPRDEADQAEILSGVFEGLTLGTPIGILVRNKDARPSAYESIRDVFRPSHADFTTEAKYGIRNWQGGGRASARETIGRVAAGAIARKLLREVAGVEVLAWVSKVQDIGSKVDAESVSLESIDANDVRCPDPDAATRMYERIDLVRRRGDSVGGIVECIARSVPVGLGDPVFDKLEADLAKAIMSLPAAKGFEIGSAANITTPSRSAPTAEREPAPTARAEFRAGSATASRCSFASRSSPQRPCASRRKRSTVEAKRSLSRPKADTTRASCRERSRWSRQWSA
jgi:chorismate synthase